MDGYRDNVCLFVIKLHFVSLNSICEETKRMMIDDPMLVMIGDPTEDQTFHDDSKRINRMQCSFDDDDDHHSRMDNLGWAYESLVDWKLQTLVIVVEHAVNWWFFRKNHLLLENHSQLMRNRHAVHMPQQQHVMHKMAEDVDQRWWWLVVLSFGKILAESVDVFFHKNHECRAVVAWQPP